MRKWTHASLCASFLLLPATAARAQGIDVTGSWAIQMQAFPAAATTAAVAIGCTFLGTANVTQTGSLFDGNIAVNLSSGPLLCPPIMSASLNGDVKGNQVDMGVVMGGVTLGNATFTVTQVTVAAGGPGGTMSGTFAVTSGPFNGTAGTFSATRVAAIAAVPTLGANGLAVLALLLLGTALWVLWRSSALRRR